MNQRLRLPDIRVCYEKVYLLSAYIEAVKHYYSTFLLKYINRNL